MSKPKALNFWQWNEIVEAFHNESDRGAAVLAGGFVDNFLASYLRFFVVDEKIGNELFGALGPLSSFSQRIALAYAFGHISKRQYEDLSLIRRIRNHFAHHPLDTSFATPLIAQLTSKLSTLETANESEPRNDAERNRRAYLFACGIFCGQAHLQMEKKGKAKAG